MRYWASALAVSGMLVMGACDSDEKPAEEVAVVETEVVNRPVEPSEYEEEEVTEPAPAMETTQASTNTAASQWNQAGWSGSSVNISNLLQEYPNVNQAIRNTLSVVDNGEYTAGIDGKFTMIEDGNVATGLRYDRMSNTSPDLMGEEMSDAEYLILVEEYDNVNRQIREVLRQYPNITVLTTDNFVNVYTDVEDDNVRMQLEELERKRTETRDKMRGKMDVRTNTYLSAEVEAAPKGGFDELYEYINEKIEYPQTAKAAEIEGTIFVEFVVDANGNVYNPRVVETIDGHRRPIREPMNPTQISQPERIEAIRNMEKAAKAAVLATDGMWDPATVQGVAVAETVQIPVRFRLTDIGID